MKNAKLNLFYADDFVFFYGKATGENTITFTTSYPEKYLDNHIRAEIEIKDEIKTEVFQCQIESVEDDRIFTVTTTNQGSFFKDTSYHSVSYNEIVRYTKISVGDIEPLKRECMRFNHSLSESLVSKIKNTLHNEDATNRHILEMLLQLDAKMDRVLSLLETHEDIKDYSEARALRISGGTITIYSPSPIFAGEKIHLINKLSAPKFCSLCEVSGVMETPTGFIANCEFFEMDELTRDNLIKYIFQRDRELIKGKTS